MVVCSAARSGVETVKVSFPAATRCRDLRSARPADRGCAPTGRESDRLDHVNGQQPGLTDHLPFLPKDLRVNLSCARPGGIRDAGQGDQRTDVLAEAGVVGGVVPTPATSGRKAPVNCGLGSNPA